MIDAKELKKGNKVLFEGMLLTIKEIKEHEATFEETPAAVEYPDIDAVPLTPELLEACGFIEGRSDYSNECIVYINTIRLFQHEDNLYSLYAYNDHKVYISFLHELQNLFYFFTNTEIEVNLNKEKV